MDQKGLKRRGFHDSIVNDDMVKLINVKVKLINVKVKLVTVKVKMIKVNVNVKVKVTKFRLIRSVDTARPM